MATASENEKHQRQIARVLAEADRPADATAEKPLEPDIPPDRTRQFRHTNFSRMRTQWGPEDQIVIEEIHAQAERVLRAKFAEAFDIRNRIWLTVRQPLMRDGQVVPGSDGYPQWECHRNGTPVEDWSQLGDRERDQFIHEITTHLYDWEQEAVKLWAEAMYAKVQWEQAFAAGYLMPTGRYTIDDRTQMGHGASPEERYFAVFQSSLSRHAEAVVRSMTRILQTLKDTWR